MILSGGRRQDSLYGSAGSASAGQPLTSELSPRSAAACCCVSAPLLSSPKQTPRPSSSVCIEWPQLGCVPGTSACARLGPGPQTSCGVLQSPGLHAGNVSAGMNASAALLETTEQLWSGGAGEARSGGCGWPAGAREVIGEPDDAAHSLIGGPGCGHFPGDVEGRGSAAGRRWAEPAAGADDAAAAVECAVGAVTSPSC